jgi:thymidylate synthase (FAD)
MVNRPAVDLGGVDKFLLGFDEELGFDKYLDDPTQLPPAELICKFAGQLCYLSFGPKRTWNHRASDYFKNIRESGHGSVLEHACFSFLFYGISRSVTHELVRHRAGAGFSQVSQRYVDGKALRFVERPEYQVIPKLHEMFITRIERAYAEYHEIADILLQHQQSGLAELSGEKKTDMRKKVNQCARSILPNETEAPIVATFNVRAIRHVLEMRANEAAEVEIRRMAYMMYCVLHKFSPILFEDYKTFTLPDNTWALATETRKV